MVAVIWAVLLRANTLAYFSLFVLLAHQMRTRCWEMVLIRDFFRVYLTVWQAVETFEVFYRVRVMAVLTECFKCRRLKSCLVIWLDFTNDLITF